MLIASIMAIGMTFWPYDIMPRWLNILGIFIGSTKFACFPVIQYLPLFFLGVYIRKGNLDTRFIIAIFILSVALSVQNSVLGFWQPVRFPPNALWILSTIWAALALYSVSKALAPLLDRGFARGLVICIGKYTLSILVISDIALFGIRWHFLDYFNGYGVTSGIVATIVMSCLYISVRERI